MALIVYARTSGLSEPIIWTKKGTKVATTTVRTTPIGRRCASIKDDRHLGRSQKAVSDKTRSPTTTIQKLTAMVDSGAILGLGSTDRRRANASDTTVQWTNE